MKVVIDQMGRMIKVPEHPSRIISLVPSQTELLFSLGLNEEIIGITKFCVHPQGKVKPIQKIGGTKKFNFRAIHALAPDLIIGNKEENYKDGIEELEKYYPVWMSDIIDLEQSLSMIREVGGIVNRPNEASEIIFKIREELLNLNIKRERSTLYLIWKNPYMSVGGDTFINEMMQLAGFKNLLSHKKRYPEITAEQIEELNPDYILLSSEPYPFKQKHIDEFQGICPGSKVLLVDGEIFSWYGSRLLFASSYFDSLKEI